MEMTEFEKSVILKQLAKEKKIANSTFTFTEEYDNEFDAFAKYYAAIKSNGFISKILQEIDLMRDPCQLFEKVSKKSQYQQLDLHYEDLAISNRNQNICYATDMVELQTTAESGRHLIAAQNLCTNTVLINEIPTVLQVTPLCKCLGNEATSLYRCHHCGIGCGTFYTCVTCNLCIFCSRTCYEIAYEEYHAYECDGVQRHFWPIWDDTDYSYLSLRMMLYGASRDFDASSGSSFYGNSSNNYPYIYDLETHFRDMSTEQINKVLYSSAKNLLYLINKSNFFTKFKHKGCMDKFSLYIGGLMVKHYCQAQINNVLLTFPNLNLASGLNTMSGTGKAICPTIALINHACNPNATIIVYAHYIVVKTIRPIRQGEEITLCYSEINGFLPLEDRRLVTQHFLFFTCRCLICELEEAANERPFKCPSCENTAIKEIEMGVRKCSGFCALCHRSVNMNHISREMKNVSKYRKLYYSSFSIEHLEKIAECYKTIFPPNSLQLLDIYNILYEKHLLWGEHPMERLKYGLLIFEIIETIFSRLYPPLLAGKLLFLVNVFETVEGITQNRDIPPEEFELLKKYVKEVFQIKNDLLFYLPLDKISYYVTLQSKVKIEFDWVIEIIKLISSYEAKIDDL
ncbi:histone-lysine N-methyltransferase SMYD3-like isoform X2 [Diabrotica virgifera virgifera]|uniref:SET domain-containing protein SmydA-8-like n=1 Tax=Diabrotica virgifera virgifera TaxID=50390 RepID=A0ABM5L896_DIAVI|nr:histone-lysine N-methyltransferase SMYD3-like isoform X2 [Diabrotica virgifera virgifera]